MEPAMWTALDAALQRAKGVKHKWGGAQLVLEGDFIQLTTGTPLFAQPGFNDSFEVIYLQQQWRSQGQLQTLLGSLAMHKQGVPLDRRLQQQLRGLERPLPPPLASTAVHLFGKTNPCRDFNNRENQALQGPAVVYKATDKMGASDKRTQKSATIRLNASTNLRPEPLHLKVKPGPEQDSKSPLTESPASILLAAILPAAIEPH